MKSKYGLAFKDFNALIGQDSYVLCNGKIRVNAGDPVSYQEALAWLNEGGQVGWLVRPGYIVVDIDEGAKETLQVLKNIGIDTLMCKTSKGLHIYLNTTEEFPQVTKWVTSWGCVADTRTAGKGYVMLPYNMENRFFNKCKNIADFNIWVQPLPQKKGEQTLYGLGEGSRNDALFRHLIKLKKSGFSPKKYTLLGKLINRFIFSEPFADEKEVLRTAASVYKRDVTIKAKGENPYQIYNARGDAIAINERAIIEYFIQNHHVIVIKKNAYAYKDGIYQEAENELRKTIQDLITEDKLVSHTRISDAYRLLVDQPQLQKTATDLLKYPYIVCFKNGVYNLRAGKFFSHDPKYLNMAQIPWNYVPAKKLKYDNLLTTKFYQFFNLVCRIPDDDMKMLLQYMAYTLTSRNDLKAFLCLLGPTDTGKSMIIRWFERLVGSTNTTHIPLQKLSERFAASRLLGKMLNSCADNPSLPIKAIDTLKCVTGNDSLTAEFKGKDSFEFTPTVKLLFSFNQLPMQLEERSDAFYNRIRILQMPLKIRPSQKIYDALFSDAAFEELIPYLMNIATNLTQIINTRNSQNNINRLHEDSDPLFGFFNSKYVTINNLHGREHNSLRKDIYIAFIDYCTENGRKPCGKHQFFRHTETLGYHFYVNRGEWFTHGIKIAEKRAPGGLK